MAAVPPVVNNATIAVRATEAAAIRATPFIVKRGAAGVVRRAAACVEVWKARKTVGVAPNVNVALSVACSGAATQTGREPKQRCVM